MPTKSRQSASVAPSVNLPDEFQRHLQRALEKFHQIEWLGEQSPLSAPYFLGKRPTSTIGSTPIITATQHGQILQGVMRQTNDWLAAQGRDTQESSNLIQFAYFQAKPLAANEVASPQLSG